MNSYLRIITCLIFGCLCLNVGAQRIKKLKGEYSSEVYENERIAEAKERVVHGAIMKAMADEFGTTMTIIETGEGNGDSFDYSSMSEAVVQGEFVRHLKDPEKITTIEEGNKVWCTAKVVFEARKRVVKNAEFEAKFYRKAADDNSNNIGVESTEFQSGDLLIMSFQSSADGYLAIYLVEGGEAYCLLPYRNDNDGKFSVKQGEEYILFSRNESHYSENQRAGKDLIEEYQMTTGKPSSKNKIYITFSTNEFSKALDDRKKDSERELPRMLPEKEFEKWLGKCRARDPQFQHKFDYITVKQR